MSAPYQPNAAEWNAFTDTISAYGAKKASWHKAAYELSAKFVAKLIERGLLREEITTSGVMSDTYYWLTDAGIAYVYQNNIISAEGKAADARENIPAIIIEAESIIDDNYEANVEISVSEVAEYVQWEGCTRSQAWNSAISLMKSGEIKSFKRDGKWYTTRKEAQAWHDAHVEELRY
jgi:hypothetical protein